MRARRFVLTLSALGAAAMPLGCAPEPEPDPFGPIAGIPSRSPLPELPTPTETIAPTPTPDPSPTPIPTRSAVIELIDTRGNPIPNTYIVSTIGETIVDVSQTDVMGTAILDVVDAGQVTAISAAVDARFSLTIDTPTGPLIKMRMAAGWGTWPDQTIEVTGANPGTEVKILVPGSGPAGGVMPADGSPLSVDFFTLDRTYQGDSRYSVGACVGPVNNPIQWGFKLDVPSGQTAEVVLRTTNDSPVLGIQQLNYEGCDYWSIAAAYEYEDVRLGHSRIAELPTNSTVSIQPWGADLADTVVASSYCERPSGAGFSDIQFRPYPAVSLSVDHTPRVAELLGVVAAQAPNGRLSVSWSHGDPLSTDSINGLVAFGNRTWEFRLRPRQAGEFTLIHPPVPEFLSSLVTGGSNFAVVYSVDADFVNGYEEAWKLHGLPRPASSNFQISYDNEGSILPLAL